VLVVAAVVLAILKPWTLLEEPVPTRRPIPSSPGAPLASPSRPEVTPTPAPVDVVRYRCSRTRAWILVTDELQGSREVRSWIRIDPVIGATGPDDPAIPWTRVGADAIRGLGACVPGETTPADGSPLPDAEGATLVIRGRLTPGAPGGWGIVPAVPYAGAMSVPGGAMVAPAGATDGAAWPVGEYVVEVRPARPGPSAWFGVRIASATVVSPDPGATAAAPAPFAPGSPPAGSTP
jgi:hypothetical protein